MTDEEIRENGENHNWEQSNDRIICPWCGYEKLVEYECYFGDSCPDVYEEGSEDLTCPECGHRFTLTKEIQWEYTTEVIVE